MTGDIEEPYTVPQKDVTVSGDPNRPEVFVEARYPNEDAPGNVQLLRNKDALELYEQLGENLQTEGYDV